MNVAVATVPRIATYRLQLTPAFGFREARALLPYLRDLGISHVYASPIAQANPGSQHGYDVCDPREVNRELGTFDELVKLLEAVRDQGMGWVQDVVPNHLAMSPHNPYLRDVLIFGQRSRWAFLFDIDWALPDFCGRILLPVLGESYAQLLHIGAFRFSWEDDGPVLLYGDHQLPLSPGSVAALLEKAGAPVELCAAFLAAEADADPDQRALLLFAAFHRSAEDQALIGGILAGIHDPTVIDAVLQAQVWQLAWWRTGREVIGYRRFFAVDALIAVRNEDQRAFPLMHALTFELYDRGLIAGVRVDHIDGLRDPKTYLEQLRARLPDAWILVEKILGQGETLASWPVDGTTGYEIVNALTAVCSNVDAEQRFTDLHQRLTGTRLNAVSLAESLRENVDRLGLGGDLDRAVSALRATAQDSPLLRDFGRRILRDALAAFVACMPVYRTYVDAQGGSDYDRRVLMQARAQAKRNHADLATVIDALAALLDLGLAPRAPATVLNAIQRIQQLSGPVMAKGWEDTFLFRWSRCLAFNEVGSDPRRFGLDPAGFLAVIAKRDPQGGLNATSTHDTKRGEDVRMRLAALTWRIDRWQELVMEWESTTAPYLHRVGDAVSPTAEDRYHLYQNLLGTWPVDGRIDEGYRARLRAYAMKAVREADCCTSWTTPNLTYEAAVLRWLELLLVSDSGAGFRAQLTALVADIAPHAAHLALVQTVLKCTIPGVPDIYQGAEWHDFSLVDPDNRRPIDFQSRREALPHGFRLSAYPLTDQRTKQALLATCLRLRHDQVEPWRSGGARSVVLRGNTDGILAFARVASGTVAIVVVRLRPDGVDPLLEVEIDPAWGQHMWREVLTSRFISASRTIPLASLLQRLPCAIFVSR